MQVNRCTITYRVNDYIRGDKLDEFKTAYQLLVSADNKMKHTDKLLKQAMLKSLKKKTEIIINDFNAIESTQVNRYISALGIISDVEAKSLFRDEYDDDGIFVTI